MFAEGHTLGPTAAVERGSAVAVAAKAGVERGTAEGGSAASAADVAVAATERGSATTVAAKAGVERGTAEGGSADAADVADAAFFKILLF